MPLILDLVNRVLASAFVDAGSLAGDQEFRRVITKEFVDLDLYPIPLPPDARDLKGSPVVGLFRGAADPAIQVQLLAHRFDFAVVGPHPASVVGDLAPIAERAALVLGGALRASGRQAHRLAFVFEAMATTLVEQPRSLADAHSALVKVPAGWDDQRLVEWDWRIVTRESLGNETVNRIASVRRLDGSLSERDFEALACSWDVNMIPEALHPRFAASDLASWLKDLQLNNQQLVEQTMAAFED